MENGWAMETIKIPTKTVVWKLAYSLIGTRVFQSLIISQDRLDLTHGNRAFDH